MGESKLETGRGKLGGKFKTNNAFSIAQKFGGSMMMPIAILPACGLLLGLGFALTNEQLLTIAPFFGEGIWPKLSEILIAVGNGVFSNLAVIFAVGIAIGLANDGAGLSALVGYFMMNQTINAVLNIDATKLAEEPTKYTSILGVGTLQTGVFGGVIIGVVAFLMYKKFHNIKLHQYLGFFQGKRFVPIATAVVSIIIGSILCVIWPIIQTGIFDVMSSVLSSDNPSIVAVFIYGLIFKLAGIFGLHHLVYTTYFYQLGSYTNSAGQIIHGDQAIYFAQLADGVKVTAGASMSGAFIIYMIGLVGAAFAIYKCAKPINRKKVSGVVIAATMTSVITGITEPLEFLFAFTAFPLYVIHSILTGLGYAIAPALGIHVGSTFSGGLIDYILSSALPNAPKWPLVIPVGICFAVAYYFIFTMCIRKFNMKTPGREEEELVELEAVTEDIMPYKIIEALGSSENITSVDACFTRLRVTVIDTDIVKDKEFKKLGASSVIRVGNGVQIVFGTHSAVLKDQVNSVLNSVPKVTENVFLSPMTGDVIPIEEVPDEVFSSKSVGEGFAIDLKEGTVVSPVNGEILQVFPTKHAIGILSDDGKEILLHIGLDTVALNGEGFEAFIKAGDKVKAGDKLLEVDVEKVKAKAKSMISPVIFTNENRQINIKKQKVVAGEKLSY